MKFVRYLILALGFSLATFPISALLITGQSNLFIWILAIINLAGWASALTLGVLRANAGREIDKSFARVGIHSAAPSSEGRIREYLYEIERKLSALQLSSLGQSIASREDLSQALERIAFQAYKLLEAESAELALFDTELSLYHSALVLGRPFHTSAQAMLSGAVEGSAPPTPPEILIAPLSFAGSELGSLRIALSKGRIPTQADQEILSVLALQAGLAIINAKYSDELLRMRKHSDESVKAKTGFLANLSHEIRGPLGIMLNASELVLDGLCGPVSEDQQETLGLVKANGAHLLELVNDVLDYAKVESGNVVPAKVLVNVGETLKDIAGVVKKQAESKKHRLVCKVDGPDLGIECDKRHLRQMLINLLTNAIKYTPEGGAIELWSERVAAGKVKILVKDSGIGIAEEDREKVFSAFERIEHGYALTQVGTGLGMPLTKRLCELNGGKIGFSSEPNKGSTFWLTFSEVSLDETGDTGTNLEIPDGKGQGQTVLLFESDGGERKIIERYLTRIGFKILSFASCKISTNDLRGMQPDLVILDSKIVDTQGDSVIAEIRELCPGAPLVLISSKAFVFDIEKQLKAGIDRSLSKPIALKELGRVCEALISPTQSDNYV